MSDRPLHLATLWTPSAPPMQQRLLHDSRFEQYLTPSTMAKAPPSWWLAAKHCGMYFCLYERLHTAGAIWELHELVRKALGDRHNCQQLDVFCADVGTCTANSPAHAWHDWMRCFPCNLLSCPGLHLNLPTWKFAQHAGTH